MKAIESICRHGMSDGVGRGSLRADTALIVQVFAGCAPDFESVFESIENKFAEAPALEEPPCFEGGR